MKKTIVNILIILMLFIFSGCSLGKKIELPNVEELKNIEILNKEENLIYSVTSDEEIKEILDSFSKAEKTMKDSVNDQPTDIDYFYTLKFYFLEDKEKNALSIAYLYEDKGDWYIEQPYTGIFKVKYSIGIEKILNN